MKFKHYLLCLLIIQTGSSIPLNAATATFIAMNNLYEILAKPTKGFYLSAIPSFLDVLASYPNEFPQPVVAALRTTFIQQPKVTKVSDKILKVTASTIFFRMPCTVELTIEYTGKKQPLKAPKTLSLFSTFAPIRVSLLIAAQRKIYLAYTFRELRKYNRVVFSTPRFWVSTMTLTRDIIYNKDIRTGATFYGTMDISALGLEPTYISKIKTLTNQLGSRSIMGGQIATNMVNTTLNLEFLPSKPIFVSSVIDITKLNFPDSFKKMLTSKPITTPQIVFNWWDPRLEFSLAGNLAMAGTNIPVKLILNREKGLPFGMFTLPNKFKVSSLFPSLSLLDSLDSRTLNLMTFPLTLPGGINLAPGLSLVVQTYLPKLPIEKELQNKLSGLLAPTQKITINTPIPSVEAQTKLNISLQLNKNINIQQLMNLTSITAPDDVKNAITSAVMNNPLLTLNIQGQTISSATLQGPLTLAKTAMNGQLQFIQLPDKSYASYLTLTPPANWKVSDLFSKINVYDKIPLQNLKITIAEKGFTEPITNKQIPVGISIAVALTQLTYFKNMDAFLTRIVKLFNPSIDITKEIPFIGISDQNNLTIRSTVPTKISVDLKSLAQQLKPPLTAFIEQILIGESTITIISDKEIAITAPVTISYQGQTTPLTYTAKYTIAPDKITLSNNIGTPESLLTFAPLFAKPWIKLEKGIIDIVFEQAKLLAANPLPTQVTLAGLCTVGTGATTFAGNASGNIGLTDITTGNCIIRVPFQTYKLDQMIPAVASIFNKPIAVVARSPIQFSQLVASILFGTYTDVNLKKSYTNSILFDGEIAVGALKGTGRVEVTPATLPNSISARIPLSSFTGSSISLTGITPLSQAATPLCLINIDSAKTANQQVIALNCVIQIPKLNLRLGKTIPLTSETVQIPITDKIYNKFNIAGKLIVPLTNPDNFIFEGNLGADFTSIVTQNLVTAVNQLQKLSPSDLNVLSMSINNLQSLANKVPIMLQNPRDENILPVLDRIKEITTRLQEVEKLPVSAMKDLEREALIREKNGQQSYVNALTNAKAGTTPNIDSVSDSITTQVTALNNLLSMSQTTMSKIKTFNPNNIVIKNPVLQTAGGDLSKGILPKVNFVIPLTGGQQLELKGFAFDPTQEETFYRNLANHIINNWPSSTAAIGHLNRKKSKQPNRICMQQYFFLS